jgi:hypothetical protein
MESSLNCGPSNLVNWMAAINLLTVKDKIIVEGDHPKIHDFNMNDTDGKDHRDEFLSKPGHKFILVAYELEKTNEKVQHKINDFVALCRKQRFPL